MPRRNRTKRKRKQIERNNNTRHNELRYLAKVLREEWLRLRLGKRR